MHLIRISTSHYSPKARDTHDDKNKVRTSKTSKNTTE
jgi:hypothetical protein